MSRPEEIDPKLASESGHQPQVDGPHEDRDPENAKAAHDAKFLEAIEETLKSHAEALRRLAQ